MAERYDDRVHTQPAVLNIGQDIGALIIYTRQELKGVEIEVSPQGYDVKRIHTAVLERQVNGRSIFAALFLSLPAGDYKIWSCDPNAINTVTITGAHVAEVDWKDIDVNAYVLSYACSHRHANGLSHSLADPWLDAPGLLPPRYRDGKKVSSAPMGTATMRYTDDGQVAWDEMWTGFCDLALAGGPSHRGSLLEPVTPTEVQANPSAYELVLAEIERGLRLVTGLPIVRSPNPGWIGLQCANEDMALWLLRAIVVENVCVRREGTVLFLPAGPAFTLEKEIKNVITVVAKTHHYWTEHLTSPT